MQIKVFKFTKTSLFNEIKNKIPLLLLPIAMQSQTAPCGWRRFLQEKRIKKRIYIKKFQTRRREFVPHFFTFHYYLLLSKNRHIKFKWRVNSEEVISKNPYTIVYGFLELEMGLEPTTCWLRISCATNCATPAWYSK